MLKSYFRVAWRNLQKNSAYSAINIAGLAIGLSVFWLMALYIADEMTYDRASVNANRIYRVTHSGTTSGGSFKLAITPPLFGPALQKDYPEVEAAARIDAEGDATLGYGDQKIDVPDMLMADSSVLTVFRFPFLYGDPANALSAPNSIVLTRTLATKLFGHAEDALNKSVTIEHDAPSLVTGIIEDQPDNSHLHFGAIRSMPPPATNDIQNSYLYTYILLRKDADIHRLEAKLPQFIGRHLQSTLAKGTEYRMDLQPVTSIHLHSALDYEISRNGDIRYIWLFSAVAILVLGIALINYVNLATARSSVRVKEIGVRKVIGSRRGQLMVMFLTESVLFALLAAAIAAFLIYALLPAFNQLSGKSLHIHTYGTIPTLSLFGGLAILIGLAGGLYPAFFLSGFRTIPSLKGQQGNQSNTILFRKSLVTLQFVVTIFLIAGSSIIYLQLHYMQNKDLGFNKDQVLTFHLPNPAVRQHIDDLKTQLLQDPSVAAAAAAGNPIGNNDIGNYLPVHVEQNGAVSTEGKLIQSLYVDAEFLSTMQIALAAGRNFSTTQPTDLSGSVLVNETMVKELGWTNPIGKRLQLQIGPDYKTGMATVIGVTKDFNFYSLQHKIQPLIMEMPPVLREDDNIYVRITPGHIAQALQHIAGIYHRFDPSAPFKYNFLDENFSRQYAAERKQGTLLLVFTMLAIIIACLGLFGLVTFSIGQRTREIGIRKVLGASVTGLVLLVSKDLIKPVVLSVLISTPLTWYAMNQWLQGFAYRVGISIWMFLAAGAVAVLIAALTVGGKASMAARANPVKSLRTE